LHYAGNEFVPRAEFAVELLHDFSKGVIGNSGPDSHRLE
jgi:hypothetical protein